MVETAIWGALSSDRILLVDGIPIPRNPSFAHVFGPLLIYSTAIYTQIYGMVLGL
jgi:hypothetical protein